MLKTIIRFFVAKCDMIPENDPTKKKTDGDFPDEVDEYFAMDMYPERRGELKKPSWARRVLVGAGREIYLRNNCQTAIFKIINESPIIRHLLSALESSGCPVDIPRLFQCEQCDLSVAGGYDAEYNQIVVCYNNVRLQGSIEGVLIHELIHVFDHCRNNISFRNHEHVACTEIRAANLVHSSFSSCYMEGLASVFSVKGSHRDCVRARAIRTMATSRNLSMAEAVVIVDKVFDRCYNDLEPFGRRVRDTYAARIIDREGKYHGY